MVMSIKCSLSFKFSSQSYACIFNLSYAYYMPLSPIPPCFDQRNIALWSVKIMMLLIMKCPLASHSRASSLFLLGPNICLLAVLSDTLSNVKLRKQILLWTPAKLPSAGSSALKQWRHDERAPATEDARYCLQFQTTVSNRCTGISRRYSGTMWLPLTVSNFSRCKTARAAFRKENEVSRLIANSPSSSSPQTCFCLPSSIFNDIIVLFVLYARAHACGCHEFQFFFTEQSS
jgi:hypothetical protein